MSQILQYTKQYQTVPYLKLAVNGVFWKWKFHYEKYKAKQKFFPLLFDSFYLRHFEIMVSSSLVQSKGFDKGLNTTLPSLA